MSIDATTDFARPNGDLAKDMRSVSGVQALVERLVSRFQTKHGSWPVDRDFGYLLTEELNDSQENPLAIASRVIAECSKDEQVATANAVATFDAAHERLDIAIDGESAVGPFQFTLQASKLTVELLRSQNEIEF